MRNSALLVAVGTELLVDGRHDQNGVTIARLLGESGISVSARLILPDDHDSIARGLAEGSGRYSLVIVTGGLGPTLDDVTREAVSSAFNLPLVQNDEQLERIRKRYSSRGRSVSDLSARQALIPAGADIIPNPGGTAPGFIVRRPDDGLVCLLPGVPHEMRTMMDDGVLPRLHRYAREKGWRGIQTGPPVASRLLKIAGMTESDVQDRLVPLFRGKDARSLTLLASPGEITLIVRGVDGTEAEETVDAAAALLGNHVFTRSGDESLEHAVGRLLDDVGGTLSTAESCTGGLLASLVTRVPGASRWFLQGWVTYSNEGKVSSLGVGPETLRAHGAVSEQTAREMALRAREQSGATFALSLTGIAGPGGGTPAKPVGLVFIGMSGPDGVTVKRRVFPGDREMVRLMASRAALDMLRRILAG